MFRVAVPVIALSLVASPLAAEVDQIAARALWDRLGQPEIVAIMRDEGLKYADDLAVAMFPDRNGPDWHALAERIYDPERMEAQAFADFVAALDGIDTAAIDAFFADPLGAEIVQLETAARRALLDPAVDDAAREAAALALADDTPRHQQIARFIAVNDLVEINVSGGLNSNYAYYIGLRDGGALGPEATEDQILSDVWSQEADIRASTGEWMYAFLTLAYQPLEDAELESYIDFSESPAGRDMNRVLFAAYDDMFNDISRALGLAAAQTMQGADL